MPTKGYTRRAGYKPRRKRSKNFVAIPFSEAVTIIDNLDGVVQLDTLLPALTEDLFIVSVDCRWGIANHTPQEGPLEVGLAHGDYTAAELIEFLDANVIDPDDMIANEHSKRKVRRSGLFSGLAQEEVLNNGNAIRTPCKFTVGDGKSFTYWLRNRSGAQLTTGTLLLIQGVVYGKWLR